MSNQFQTLEQNQSANINAAVGPVCLTAGFFLAGVAYGYFTAG